MGAMTDIDKGRLALAAVSLASLGALGTALASQHIFGFLPCDLCYAQRVPYALNFVLGALAVLPAVPPRERRVVLMHLVVLFVLGAGLAGYHVGVEEGWWAGPTSCTGGGGSVSMNDLMGALSQSARPACDEAPFRFLGISFAGFNVIASLALTALGTWAMKQKAWWGKA